MNDTLNDGAQGLERPLFVALVALLLAPILAHGLWRPLIHIFGPSGDAASVTGAALAITVVVVVVHRFPWGQKPFRALIAGMLTAIAASAGLSLGLPGLLTLWSVALGIGFGVPWLSRQLPSALDGLAGRHKVLTAFYIIFALFAVITTARLSIFMGDSRRVDQQVLPGMAFLETHSCLTAYVQADTLSRQGVENLYDAPWWQGSHGFPPRPEGVENPYAPFLLDYYAYPPPFLLVMAPLAPLEGDFPAQRALWFGLNSLLGALGLWGVYRWIEGPKAHRILLLTPIFFASLPILATLQTGNFQMVVVVMSVCAMVAFHRNRPVIGGALLAFAILSKISPGVLGIVLLAQRRWRAAAWTAGFGLFYIGLSTLIQGVDPLKFFLTYTLPRLSSGETFAFMDDDAFSLLTNMSPFGLSFKLQLLGLDVGDPWKIGRQISRVYSLFLIILAVVAGRRLGDRHAQILIWMSLLVLGSLQSPFAPGYVAIGLLWAMIFLTVEVRRAASGMALVIVWLFLTVPIQVSMTVQTVQSVLQTILVVGMPIWLILRGGPSNVIERGAIAGPRGMPKS